MIQQTTQERIDGLIEAHNEQWRQVSENEEDIEKIKRVIMMYKEMEEARHQNLKIELTFLREQIMALTGRIK